MLLYTDESSAHYHIPETGCEHVTVCHSRRELACDDDDDGFCEVHRNTTEGIWTSLRNSLRSFRNVHQRYLTYYVAMFDWAHNLKLYATNSCARLWSLRSPDNPYECRG